MSLVISARTLATDAAQPREKPFELQDSRLSGFILRVQPSGVRSYYARLSSTRRIRVGRVGELTPEEARERATRIMGNHALGRPPLAGLESSAGITLKQFVDDVYEPWLKLHRPRTAGPTLYCVRHYFAAWDNYPLPSINATLIDQWITKHVAAGGKPSSIRRHVDTLAGVLRRAVKSKHLDKSPMRDVDKPKLDRNPKVRYLSEAEQLRLRDALRERDAKMVTARQASAQRMRKQRGVESVTDSFGDHVTPGVLLTLRTGMRLGELLSLRWDNVSLLNGQERITLEGGVTKNGHTRHIPLHDEAIQLLRDWKRQAPKEERVFPFKSMKTAWKALMKAANIKGFRWHDMRHHFASMLVMRGVPLNTVRELLGHSSITMVLRYAHLSQTETRAAVNLL